MNYKRGRNISLVFLALVSVVLLLLSTPYVQTQLAQKLTQRLNTSLETGITVGKTKINYKGNIVLKDLIARDHHGDTLFFIKAFTTNAKGVRELVAGNLKFSNAATENVYVKIIHYQGEATSSLGQFINKLKARKKRNENPLLFNVAALAVTGGELFWDNRNNQQQQRITNLQLEASDFILRGNELSTTIAEATMNWDNNLQLKAFQGKFKSSPTSIALTAATMETASSAFDGDIELNYPLGGLSAFASKVTMDATAAQLSLGEDVQQLLINKTLEHPLTGAFQLKGTLNDFKLSNTRLRYQSPVFEGDLAVKQFTSPEKRRVDATITSLQLHPVAWTAVQELVPNFKSNLWLDSLTHFTTSGKLNYTSKAIAANLQLQKEAQKIVLEAQVLNPFDAAPTISLHLPYFSVNRFGVPKTPITAQGQLTLNGRGFNLSTAAWSWETGLDYFELGTRRFTAFKASGNLQQGTLNTNAQLNDAAVKVNFLSTHTLNEAVPRHTFITNLTEAQFPVLGSTTPGVYRMSGKFVGTLQGSTLQDVVGNISTNALQLTNTATTTQFKDFVLQFKKTDQERQLIIQDADLIRGVLKGQFAITALPALVLKTLNGAFPFFKNQYVAPGSYCDIDIIIGKKIFSALDPNWQSDKEVTIKGKLTTAANLGFLNLKMPKWRNNTTEAAGIAITILADKAQESTLTMERLWVNKYPFHSVAIKSVQTDEGLAIDTKAFGPQEDQFEFQLRQRQNGGNQFFYIAPSGIRFRGKSWQLNPMNSPNHGFQYNTSTGRLDVLEFAARAPKDFIQAKGYFVASNNFSADVSLTKVALESVLPKTKNFQFKGEATLDVQVQRSAEQNVFLLNGEIDTFSINNTPLGKFTVDSKGNTAFGAYALNFNTTTKNRRLLQGNGSLTFSEAQPKLDLNLTFDTFPLAFLNPLGGNALTNIKGNVSGTTSLFGPIAALQHQGRWTMNEAGFQIPVLNTEYKVQSGARVQLTGNTFTFNTVTIKSAEAEDNAVLNGQLLHNNFKDWRSNLAITTSGLHLLNTPPSPTASFYGQGFFSGTIDLTGPFKSPELVLQGKTEPKTAIEIPWNDTPDAADTSFISFVNKNATNDKATPTDAQSGLEVRMELEVTPDAAIGIVIDPETNSTLNGSGLGNLLMTYNTKGSFNMWGDFIATEGVYNFRNLGVLDKKFSLRPGGTVVWEGDPLGAQMDFEAVYAVPGGANPALLLDNPDFNRKIPTDVHIRLQGDLLRPDDPTFEIDFPTTGGAVVTELQYRLNDPQRSQLQALSLLSQGIFISDVGVSMQGLANNLYEKASDVFSSLLDENNEKLKVGVNYLQGDKSSPVDLVSEDRLGLTLSTQISDRILINGKIGVPVGGVEETLIVGNVQIDFILNEEGTLKAKVFNKENEFRFFGDQLGYTQGMGLNYQVDFDTFSELLNKIVKGAQENKQPTPTTFQEAGVNIVPKNN